MKCRLLLLGIIGLGILGCSQKNEFVPPPPTQVEVASPVIKDTSVYVDFPATTQASMQVEIRARVHGLLETEEFEPGQYVEKGQLLFTIEPEEYEAAVNTAEGNLEKAKADKNQKEVDYQRKKTAFDSNRSVSELDVVRAEADLLSAEAEIKIRETALADAERNLRYTKITSPISGRISRSLVDQGSLVGTGESTLLTTVVQDTPLYVYFEVNEREILPFLDRRPKKGEELHLPDVEVRLTLSNGEVYPRMGNINFIDNAVNTNTGSVQLRAEFENPDGKLASGLFGRVGLPQQVKGAIMVSEVAIQRDLGGSYVLALNEDNTLAQRKVVPTDFKEGEMRILEAEGSDLQASDKVVVSNLQRVRAGVEVAIKQPQEEPPVEKTAQAAEESAATPAE